MANKRIAAPLCLASVALLSATLLLAANPEPKPASAWEISTQAQWAADVAKTDGLEIKDGLVSPTGETVTFASALKTFKTKRSAASLTLSQTVSWDNWTETPKQVGPGALRNAPIFLPISKGNYWMFGCVAGSPLAQIKGKTLVTIEGIDEKVYKTAVPNLYISKTVYDLYGKSASKAAKATAKTEAAAKKKRRKSSTKDKAKKGALPRGYHGWQSPDMVNWIYRGPIAGGSWATTAEYADGKLYVYVDTPNDRHPFLTIDEDLFDGKPGKGMGMIFNDPTNGSDCAVIRDEKGFHLFSEDWSPLNASKHSWDSPLGQRAFSPDSIKPFVVKNYFVDYRTKATGETATNPHPHWKVDCTYNVHEGEQPAYGDWAGLRVGGQYYLVGDNHTPERKDMSVMLFTSTDITKQFKRLHTIPSQGHPDPAIGFAEGQFYLITQAKDFTSPGPWVDGVKARAGVDTDNDGKIDQWTEWQSVKETYTQKKGYTKLIDKTPAQLDLSKLPAGFGFQFEVKLTPATKNASKPILDSATMEFK
ncbi:MAG: hypothetical protein HN909_03935 [Phycisphaerales bacterium]|jgi:hypothetical protein|nr:hypothetical protein [Phycisphaerales bacterium]MBT7170903.1 hypothetical protein [Phycisphaerales bacterium]